MALIDTIKTLVEEEVENTPYFLVEIISGERSRKIQVLMDGDEGISIRECSRISRAISKVVDEEGFEADPFILEVSSPGADMPLKNKRQYHKHIGRSLEVETIEGIQTIKLLEVKDDRFLGEPKRDKKSKNKKEEAIPVEIAFDDIIKSTVVLSFK